MKKRVEVLICGGTGCTSSGSDKVAERMIEELKKRNLLDEVNVIRTGCRGMCEFGPVVKIYPDDVLYAQVEEKDVPEIVEEHIIKGRPVKRLLWHGIETPAEEKKHPFFSKQLRVVLSNCGEIDPENIEEYIAVGGYEALSKVLTEMTPEQVIDVVLKSGLRGRGGAGFPTGLKWKFGREAKGEEKYVICNGDEGDPGAFMDRSVFEGDPHAVIEGMIIAGYAIGAHKGYVYIRAEYPLAVKRIQIAINQAREYGLLGKNILETGFDFDIEVRQGAGAFVCGEETALIASIEGKRGQPRPKPPFPAQKGLWGKPTIINNVETLANIRHIILKGPEWFASIGTEKSKGTKVFALTGKLNNTGLVEVPMGITLGEIIYDIGGGIPKNKKFKAVQIGGPSGGCIPKEHLNTPVDYESLTSLGAIMGSGGLIVLDEDTCMVNMAKFFLEFTVDESCGQCPPCRIGLKQMLKILDRITKGEGKLEDIEELERLGKIIKEASLCGLGQTAPNPVLSTLRYFKDEYIEHIVDKKCRAGVCASLFYAPCENACPANVDVPRYVSLMAEGKLEEAFKIHMERNPFPSICGRVCPAFCEAKCERGKLDEPIAIREIKRVFADWAKEKGIGFAPPENPKKEKVAIIGAGPAGLSCAFYLTRLGYKPVVFEALPVAGGMMRIGIPDYRLPKDIVESEIKRIEKAGVEIRLNSPVSSIRELKEKGFDAIFIGIGAQESRKLNIPGEDLEGEIYGIDFLKMINLDRRIDLTDKRVMVFGGGSTAMDAARTALRLNAKEVIVSYRRSRNEMPAQPEEVEEAMEEGIKFLFLTNPVEFSGKEKLEKVKLTKMEFKGFDKSGRRRPVPVKGSEFDMDVDLAIVCIGQKAKISPFKDELEITERGQIKVNPRTLETSMPGVFAGGDVNNPSTVVEAVRDGRIAAISIDKYFGYDGILPFPERVEIETHYNEEEYLKEIPRKKPKLEDIEKRIKLLSLEVNKGLLKEEAMEEAKRCLHCDRGKKVVKKEIYLTEVKNG